MEALFRCRQPIPVTWASGLGPIAQPGDYVWLAFDSEFAPIIVRRPDTTEAAYGPQLLGSVLAALRNLETIWLSDSLRDHLAPAGSGGWDVASRELGMDATGRLRALD